jgi:hypothetical protein
LLALGFEAQPGGTYAKGSGRKRVVIRPTALMPLKLPGERGYNPRVDAFALRLGAKFIEYGRWAGKYELGNVIVDHLGAAIDTDACSGCGSKKRQVDYHLSVLAENRNPFAKPWEQVWTYCKVCTPREEIAALRAGSGQPVESAKKQRAKQGRLH